MAKKIKIIIERGKELYSAWAENVEGIYGTGETVAEVKQSIEDALHNTIAFNTPQNIHATLKGDFELVYKFDTESFFNYYKGLFNKAGLEKLTGISQGQLQHYASGVKKPRPAQAKKIEKAMHQLGSELLAVEL